MVELYPLSRSAEISKYRENFDFYCVRYATHAVRHVVVHVSTTC
jgi:hypothetical protein